MKKTLILLLLSIVFLTGCQSNTYTRYADDLSIEDNGLIYSLSAFYESGENLTFILTIENKTDQTQTVVLDDVIIKRLSNAVGYPVNTRRIDDTITISKNQKENLSCVVVLPTSIESEDYKLTFGKYTFNLFEK